MSTDSADAISNLESGHDQAKQVLIDPEITKNSEGLPTPTPEESTAVEDTASTGPPPEVAPTETVVESDELAKRERDLDEVVDDLPDSKKLKTEETVENELKKDEESSSSTAPPMVPAPTPPAEPDLNNLPETPMPKHQAKHALTTIKAVRRLKDAAPFLVPVDIVKNNIPFYYNYIPRPMDLSTIERKINLNAYESPQQVTDDFNLMVANCEKFNGKESAIAQMARNVQANFEKHMLNMPPKDAPPGSVGLKGRRKTNTDVSGVPRLRRESAINDGRPKREIHPPKSKDITYESKPRKKKFIPELRFCSQVLKELLSKKHESISYPFITPVDPVALGCPTYFDVVKHPMDLGTIQSKLSNNEYENADEFEADVRLVFQNAYAFNPPSTPVNMMGHRLEEIFDKKWVDRPATPPSPQNLSDYDSDSDDELEEIKIDQSVLTNPAIEYLELQIERMRKDLDKMKQDLYDQIKLERMAKRRSKKGGRRGGAGSKRKKGRDSISNGLVTGPITFDMKQELSNKLADLPEEDTEGVVQIIQSMKNPPAPVNDEGEMELELDALDQETITKLYNFVFKKKKRSGPGRPSSGIMRNRREKKLISEDEQNNRIENLRKQLKRFDGDGGESSSEDDDESEESSEEE